LLVDKQKGMYIGIAIAVVFLYTNIFELAKPTVKQFVVSTKDAVSQIECKDVVSGAEVISASMLNETSKIAIKNTLP